MRYEILLFLHVATAIVWLGGAMVIQFFAFRAERATDPLEMQRVASDAEWLAVRLFVPASLAVLVFGILLVLDGPWSFDQLWIVLGLAGYAISFLVGILFLEPEGKRIGAAMAAGDKERAGWLIRRINAVSRLELTVLYLVVAAMVLKPTGEDTGTLLLFAVALLVALALWGPRLRVPAAAPAG